MVHFYNASATQQKNSWHANQQSKDDVGKRLMVRELSQKLAKDNLKGKWQDKGSHI